MTDEQRKNMAKMLINVIQEKSSMEESMMKAVQEAAHITKMMYDAYLHEGFSDEQGMFLTTSAIEAVLMTGGMK